MKIEQPCDIVGVVKDQVRECSGSDLGPSDGSIVLDCPYMRLIRSPIIEYNDERDSKEEFPGERDDCRLSRCCIYHGACHQCGWRDRVAFHIGLVHDRTNPDGSDLMVDAHCSKITYVLNEDGVISYDYDGNELARYLDIRGYVRALHKRIVERFNSMRTH